jgi:hypothetical protein
MDRIDNIIKESLDNFLHDYRRFTTNKAHLVSINEMNAKSMINKHSKTGYIAISPCRGYDDFKDYIKRKRPAEEQLAEINRKRVQEMIQLIKESGYSYTPVYGGFIENKGTDRAQNVYERSFIIYNHDKEGNIRNFKDLYDFGLFLAQKYNQDSFLSQAPNDVPKYITQDGKVDMTFSKNAKFNDLSQEYFTDLHKNTDKHNIKDTPDFKPTRFSYVETYINPAPQCLSEAHTRFLNNEVTLSYRQR